MRRTANELAKSRVPLDALIAQQKTPEPAPERPCAHDGCPFAAAADAERCEVHQHKV